MGTEGICETPDLGGSMGRGFHVPVGSTSFHITLITKQNTLSPRVCSLPITKEVLGHKPEKNLALCRYLFILVPFIVACAPNNTSNFLNKGSIITQGPHHDPALSLITAGTT